MGAIYKISHLSFSFFGAELPIPATIIIVGLLGFIFWQRKKITPRRIVGSIVVILMIALSQLVQDIYSVMSVYDLQQNWHYVTFATYVMMFFYAFGVTEKNKAKRIFGAFLTAFCLSTFDELFQLKMSARVFDISDIAKDAWGAMIGLVLIFFVTETYGTIELHRRKILPPSIRDYHNNPLAALVLTGLFSLILILVSPLLTAHHYIGSLIITFLSAFAAVMILLHLCRNRRFRIVFTTILGIIILTLIGSFIANRNSYISYANNNLIVYKGIPVPFFDLIIYQDSWARLSDKKYFFNDPDFQCLLSLKPDILLIGNGFPDQRGEDVAAEEGVQLKYNHFSKRGTQVIVLNTPDACKIFNRMKRAGKDVLFVVHNTH